MTAMTEYFRIRPAKGQPKVPVVILQNDSTEDRPSVEEVFVGGEQHFGKLTRENGATFLDGWALQPITEKEYRAWITWNNKAHLGHNGAPDALTVAYQVKAARQEVKKIEADVKAKVEGHNKAIAEIKSLSAEELSAAKGRLENAQALLDELLKEGDPPKDPAGLISVTVKEAALIDSEAIQHHYETHGQAPEGCKLICVVDQPSIVAGEFTNIKRKAIVR